jgi:[ribosomal protein S5]-alanine N-acetyltransferase
MLGTMTRVTIAAPTAADGDDFTAAMRASRRMHRPWISMPETPDAYAAYLARSTEPTRAFFIARRADDGAVAGFLNVSEMIRGKLQSAFIGYGGTAQTAGQGLMTDAMRLVLREVFTSIGLHRLEANIQPGNTASKALAERCGFRCEGFSPKYLKVGGRWRDHERWAITRDDWKATRAARGAR